MKKRYFIIIFLLLIGFSASAQLFETEPPLEINYPDVPGAEGPERSTSIGEYISYLFYFFIYGSGALALLALIYGGFKYLTSAGNPDKMKDAKDRIISAILGLVIVLSSYAILWEINPQLVNPEMKEIDPLIDMLSPGILACKSRSNHVLDAWGMQMAYILENPSRETKEMIKVAMDVFMRRIEEDCYYIKGSGEVADEFNNKIRRLWFIPDLTLEPSGDGMRVARADQYGALVFEQDKFRGLGQVYLSQILMSELVPVARPVDVSLEISSVIPFKGTENDLLPDWSVQLFEEKEYNKDFTDEEGNPLSAFFNEIGILSMWLGDIDFASGEITPEPISEEGVLPLSMRRNGDILVILYKGEPVEKTTTTCNELRASVNLIAIERERTLTCPENYTITEAECTSSESLQGETEIIEQTENSLTCRGRDESDYCLLQGACDVMDMRIRCCGPETYTGRYFEAFFAEDDNNLEDNRNIINYAFCPTFVEEEQSIIELTNCQWSPRRHYSVDQNMDCQDYFGSGFMMVNYDCWKHNDYCRYNRIKCCKLDLDLEGLNFCPQAAVNGIVVINGIEPL